MNVSLLIALTVAATLAFYNAHHADRYKSKYEFEKNNSDYYVGMLNRRVTLHDEVSEQAAKYLSHLKMAMWNLRERREQVNKLRIALQVVTENAEYALSRDGNRKDALTKIAKFAKRCASTM